MQSAPRTPSTKRSVRGPALRVTGPSLAPRTLFEQDFPWLDWGMVCSLIPACGGTWFHPTLEIFGKSDDRWPVAEHAEVLPDTNKPRDAMATTVTNGVLNRGPGGEAQVVTEAWME